VALIMFRAPLVSSLLAGVVATWSLPAMAAPVDDRDLDAREAEAKRACDSGRVEEGARLLGELLRRTNDGTYIFNLARCHQQNGQVDRALSEFHAYLGRPDVDPAAAARAREYIAALERPPQAPMADAAAAPPPAAAPASHDLVAPAQAPSSPGRALHIAALVSGGIGLVGLVTGGAYALQTHSLQQETRDALDRRDQPPEWFARQDEKGERAERLQWLFLGVGGAALAAGGALYYFGARAESANAGTPHAMRALPLVLPGVAGAALTGRF
jgi:hypothetical protein